MSGEARKHEVADSEDEQPPRKRPRREEVVIDLTGEVEHPPSYQLTASIDDANQRKPSPQRGRRTRSLSETGAVISLLSSDDDDDDDDGEKPKRKRARRQRRHSEPHVQNQFMDAAVAPTFHDALQRNLSHDCKREHFEDARRPQFRLEQELQHLRAQLGSIDSSSSDEYHVCSTQIRLLEKELENVKRNAAQDIYNRNNSAGRMGEVDAQGNVTVDLHGLYVREAISMFNELVLPILPAVRNRVAIITGKGKHSSGKGGSSAPLRSGLIAHIEKTAEYRAKRLQCSVDKKNPGRVWVSWNDGSNNKNPRV